MTPRSGKTTAGVIRYARFVEQSPDMNHLVAAYNQEQAFRLFMDCDGFGLMHLFSGYCKISHDEHGDHLFVQTAKGPKKIYYKGGGKADSKKAITGMSLGSVAFCEIDLLHLEFVQECFRRTFAAHQRWHLADLNPPSPNAPIIKDVFDVQDTKWTHWTIEDNPIITEERKKDIYNTLVKNPYLFARDWEGKRVIPDGVIYSMFSISEQVKESLLGKPIEMYFSADGGQSDATSCSCNIVTKLKDHGYRLNRVANYYHSGKDTGQTKAMSQYALYIKDFIQYCVDFYEMRYTRVFVDPACKSLREELHLIGVQTDKADNNNKDIKGSSKGIEVGIERVQNLINEKKFYLVENNKYDHYHFIKEVGIYSRDKNGKPIDADNHALDELRYSVNYFYKNYVL